MFTQVGSLLLLVVGVSGSCFDDFPEYSPAQVENLCPTLYCDSSSCQLKKGEIETKPRHISKFGPDGRACEEEYTDDVRLAIAGSFFGRQTEGPFGRGDLDCTAWCLFDVSTRAGGPKKGYFRWNNDNECWDRKRGSRCADLASSERDHAVLERYDRLCPNFDKPAPWVAPTCPLRRVVTRDGSRTCWETDGLHQGPVLVNNAANKLNRARFNGWFSANPGANPGDFCLQDPKVFAYATTGGDTPDHLLCITADFDFTHSIYSTATSTLPANNPSLDVCSTQHDTNLGGVYFYMLKQGADCDSYVP